jgi:hypothetical protein
MLIEFVYNIGLLFYLCKNKEKGRNDQRKQTKYFKPPPKR